MYVQLHIHTSMPHTHAGKVCSSVLYTKATHKRNIFCLPVAAWCCHCEQLSAPCMSCMCIVAVTDCQHKGECSGESVTGERDL